MKDYSDIINMKYPFPSNHQKMRREHRASQFAPFAALTGFSESITSANKDVFKSILLDEDFRNEINRKLIDIKENFPKNNKIKLTYYLKDEYLTKIINIKKIDDEFITDTNNDKYPIECVINISDNF